MPLTRQQSKDILTHVVGTVLHQAADSDFMKALDALQIDEIEDLNTLLIDDLCQVTFKDDQGADTHLISSRVNLLHLLQGFIKYRKFIGAPLVDNDGWMHLTKDEFDEYRLSDAGNVYSQSPSTYNYSTSFGTSHHTSTASTFGASSSSATTSYTVASFKKGIKRDSAAFKQIKDIRQLETFFKSLAIQAAMQDVSEPLDPDYTPLTQEEKDLFRLKQDYMFGVFDQTMKAQQLRSFVLQHMDDRDAQAVHRKLIELMKTSTHATTASGKILGYLATARYDLNSWKGSSESFLLHFEKQFDSLQNINPDMVPTDHVKKLLLLNATKNVKDFRDIKSRDDQALSQSGNALTYSQLFQLMLSAAVNMDDVLVENSTTRSHQQRKVYLHELSGIANDDGAIDIDDLPSFCGVDDEFDIDTPIATIEAFKAAHLPGSHMSGAQWHKLSPKGQKIWDTLDDNDKAAILGGTHGPSTQPPAQAQLSRHPPILPDASRRLHLAKEHDVSNSMDDDSNKVLSYHHELGVPDADIDPGAATVAESTTLLANATKQQRKWTPPKALQLPPGDIRKALSYPNAY